MLINHLRVFRISQLVVKTPITWFSTTSKTPKSKTQPPQVQSKPTSVVTSLYLGRYDPLKTTIYYNINFLNI